MTKDTRFVCPKAEFTFGPGQRRKFNNGKACEVTFPVSQAYNGGIIWNGEWYQGLEVPRPDVPAGWRIHNIGVGLQMNARPPYATVVLEPI